MNEVMYAIEVCYQISDSFGTNEEKSKIEFL